MAMLEQKPENLPIAKIRADEKTIDLNDPRSPSSDFRRTPIRVILQNSDATAGKDERESNVSAEKTSRIYSTPSNSIDCTNLAKKVLQRTLSSDSFVSMEDSSSFYSAALESPHNLNSSVYRELEDSDKLMDEAMAESPFACEKNKINANEELPRSNEDDESIAGEIVCPNTEPSRKSNQSEVETPSKKRNPLESVESNCLQPASPLSRSSPRVKQWKRIREERQKLGLTCDENFAPPLYDVTASAPSKLMIRKQKLWTEF